LNGPCAHVSLSSVTKRLGLADEDGRQRLLRESRRRENGGRENAEDDRGCAPQERAGAACGDR
ncbi:MAG: hypothetical protein WAK01_15045, partial [Methylocystis sp.]